MFKWLLKLALGLALMNSSLPALLGAEAEPELIDIKKNDFSMGVKTKRCLLRKEAAVALMDVQRVLKISGQSLVLKKCYLPGVPGFCSAGQVGVEWETKGLGKQIVREMKRVGFETLPAHAGQFVYRESQDWPCLSIALDKIP